jgi:hypothetical protein
MQAENKERWMAFCARIAEEQDRDTLIALVDELNVLLEEEGKRLGILPRERSEYLTAQAP